MGQVDSKERFSDRVENYVRYRPSYSPAAVGFLREAAGLTPGWVVADVGSGTGISTRLLLENGNTVFAVEPNAAMRGAAERLLAGFSGFRSVDGAAERTTLPDASVDLILAGQAFHWFDPTPTREEFRRILRPGGWVVLMWNTRHLRGTPFLDGYERLLHEFGCDYQSVRCENVSDAAIGRFLAPGWRLGSFPNAQQFDYPGLEGRLLSSSYAPGPDHPRHAPMLAALRRLFDQTNIGGKVTIQYDTQVYLGRA